MALRVAMLLAFLSLALPATAWADACCASVAVVRDAVVAPATQAVPVAATASEQPSTWRAADLRPASASSPCPCCPWNSGSSDCSCARCGTGATGSLIGPATLLPGVRALPLASSPQARHASRSLEPDLRPPSRA